MNVTEAQVQARVLDELRWHGFRVVHFRPARTERGWRTPFEGDAGFPDVIAARGGVGFAFELKGSAGRLGAGQREWGDALGGDDGGVITWRLVHPGNLNAVAAEIQAAAAGLVR